MKHSESIAALAAALAAAQADLRNPALDSTNPHFRSRFASLAGVRDTIQPALAKQGISVLQLLGQRENGMSCETVLMHKSGEWISGEVWMPATKPDAQGFGSAATYARRYSLMAIVSVVGDEDDDGNAASQKPKQAQQTITPTTGAIDRIPAARQASLQSIVDSIVDAGDAGAIPEAYWAYSAVTDTDEKVAIWEMLKPHSALRRAIKAYGEKMRNEGDMENQNG